MLCLSGFELYSPWVPLKCTKICVDLVNFRAFTRITTFHLQTLTAIHLKSTS